MPPHQRYRLLVIAHWATGFVTGVILSVMTLMRGRMEILARHGRIESFVFGRGLFFVG